MRTTNLVLPEASLNGNGYAQLDVTAGRGGEILTACKDLMRHFQSGRAVFAYAAFEFVNATYFGGELPTPLIVWALTPFGACLGRTRPSSGPPVITLHPSLLAPSKDGKPSPWGFDPEFLGVLLALDVLVHECTHVRVIYGLGYQEGPGETSHNNPAWVGEVNRLAPLLGLGDVQAEQNKVRRVVVEGEFTKTGKPKTKPARVQAGEMPYGCICRFPHELRRWLGVTDYYRSGTLPFAFDLEANGLGV